MKPLLIIDNAIPFLEGRLDRDFDFRILSPAEIDRKVLGEAKGLLVRTRTRCNSELLDDTPVEFVATGTIGLDHFDIPYLDSRGIDWQNAPGCNAPAVAQYVWRALIELGFDPKTQTLGVVGKGNVGSIVVEWGRLLGANVIVCDPPRKDAGMTDEEYLQLGELMSRADAVTFHTPLDNLTYHLADREMLEKLRPGAIIINAARGGVVDEAALLQIKEEKGIKAAIDTWEMEPHVNPSMLEKADLATFHIAGYSRQGKERATYAILSGLERHFGAKLDKSGLAGPYRRPEILSIDSIRASYDIKGDDEEFRRHPEDFESLRDQYSLREEIK